MVPIWIMQSECPTIIHLKHVYSFVVLKTSTLWCTYPSFILCPFYSQVGLCWTHTHTQLTPKPPLVYLKIVLKTLLVLLWGTRHQSLQWTRPGGLPRLLTEREPTPYLAQQILGLTPKGNSRPPCSSTLTNKTSSHTHTHRVTLTRLQIMQHRVALLFLKTILCSKPFENQPMWLLSSIFY